MGAAKFVINVLGLSRTLMFDNALWHTPLWVSLGAPVLAC
jgi:hypothetical protein